MLLAASAGVAGAATGNTSSSNSWFGYMVNQVECAFGSQSACMAVANSGPGVVSPDAIGDPMIKNKPS